MKPKYDERGFASLFISRFDDEQFSKLPSYPVHALELHPQPEDDPLKTRKSIPTLLDKFGSSLERLDIRNTFSVVDDTERVREVLPCKATAFRNLPHLRVVNFTRVNVNDAIVNSLCKNAELYRVSVDQAQITKRCIKYLSQCPQLRIVTFRRCVNFPEEFENELRQRLHTVEKVFLK